MNQGIPVHVKSNITKTRIHGGFGSLPQRPRGPLLSPVQDSNLVNKNVNLILK